MVAMGKGTKDKMGAMGLGPVMKQQNVKRFQTKHCPVGETVVSEWVLPEMPPEFSRSTSYAS